MPNIIPIDEAIKSAEQKALDADWHNTGHYAYWINERNRLLRLRDNGQNFEVMF